MHSSSSSPSLPPSASSKRSYRLKDLAQLTKAEVRGDPERLITAVADLRSAGPSDIAFFADSRYQALAESTQAGALIIQPDAKITRTGPALITTDPKSVFVQICQLFSSEQPLHPNGSIHPTAVIAPSARIGKGVVIGPHVVIEEDVSIGDGCQIAAGCYIGCSVQMGMACKLFPHVTLLGRSLVGNRVVLQPGVVIGSLGFGYTTNKNGEHTWVPHFGRVILEDDVEVGANSTIDCAQLESTLIGKGTKIDNQVQIAHNVIVGPHNLIVAQVGIAGSSSTGNNVVLAGQVGINDHIDIGPHVIITACSAVSKNLPNPGLYGGTPAEPFSLYKRNLVHARKLTDYVQRLNKLEERLLLLEKCRTS